VVNPSPNPTPLSPVDLFLKLERMWRLPARVPRPPRLPRPRPSCIVCGEVLGEREGRAVARLGLGLIHRPGSPARCFARVLRALTDLPRRPNIEDRLAALRRARDGGQ
jgi:hypothetical protein